VVQEKIDKTIVASYDDITRIADFCKKDGVISKDFMDWYVKENTFFSKTGMLIIEDIFHKQPQNKFCFSFDFTDYEYPKFSMYDYYTQKQICNYTFDREKNISMNDISININSIDENYTTVKNYATFYSEKLNDDDEEPARLFSDKITSRLKINAEKYDLIHSKIEKIQLSLIEIRGDKIKNLKELKKLSEELLDTYTDVLSRNIKIKIRDSINIRIKEIDISIDKNEIELKTLNAEYKHKNKEIENIDLDLKKMLIGFNLKLYKYMSERSIYFCYSTMYYYAKNKSKEITLKQKKLLDDGIKKQINSIYKYTGYVNIDEAKIYKPIIEKDDNEPKREYERHIERWSVRGHYRRINGNLTWIDNHFRGEGNLEKRIYGTENESDINVYPKVFEVNRKILINGTTDNENINLPDICKHASNTDKKVITNLSKEPSHITHNKTTELITNKTTNHELKKDKQSFIKRIINNIYRIFKLK